MPGEVMREGFNRRVEADPDEDLLVSDETNEILLDFDSVSMLVASE